MENKIDGGPACDYIWRGPEGELDVNLQMDPDKKHREDCPGCQGYNVKPLPEWTADECAEWLKPKKRLVGAVNGWVQSESGGTLTEYLRAAVAAVAKERE